MIKSDYQKLAEWCKITKISDEQLESLINYCQKVFPNFNEKKFRVTCAWRFEDGR